MHQSRQRPPSFDARASALSYGTQRIYEQLNLWPEVASEATAILDVHVSDKGYFGKTRLRSVDEGVPALGYVVENFVLGEALLNRVERYRSEGLITVLSPEQVQQLTPKKSGMEVKLADQIISSSLVILAEGGRSGLICLLYTSPSPRDGLLSRMPSSA